MCYVTKGQKRKFREFVGFIPALLVSLLWQAIKVAFCALIVGVVFLVIGVLLWFLGYIFGLDLQFGLSAFLLGARVGAGIGVVVIICEVIVAFSNGYNNQ